MTGRNHDESSRRTTALPLALGNTRARANVHKTDFQLTDVWWTNTLTFGGYLNCSYVTLRISEFTAITYSMYYEYQCDLTLWPVLRQLVPTSFLPDEKSISQQQNGWKKSQHIASQSALANINTHLAVCKEM
ncbi:unnamed protein product [Absidia cylindrospora]